MHACHVEWLLTPPCFTLNPLRSPSGVSKGTIRACFSPSASDHTCSTVPTDNRVLSFSPFRSSFLPSPHPLNLVVELRLRGEGLWPNLASPSPPKLPPPLSHWWLYGRSKLMPRSWIRQSHVGLVLLCLDKRLSKFFLNVKNRDFGKKTTLQQLVQRVI